MKKNLMCFLVFLFVSVFALSAQQKYLDCIPVLVLIHSSSVSTILDISSLVTFLDGCIPATDNILIPCIIS